MKFIFYLILIIFFTLCGNRKPVEPDYSINDINEKDIFNVDIYEELHYDLKENFDLFEEKVEKIGGCDECGYGSLKGIACAPNGKTSIPDAHVFIETENCNGEKLFLETYSDEKGEYTIENVPCGEMNVNIEKGSFKHNFNIFIDQGIVNDVSLKIGDRCFSKNAAKIAVIKGEWDHIQNILDELELKYDFYELYLNDVNYGGEWKGGPAVNLLKDLKKMKEYDIIFINCGAPHLKIVKEEDDVIENLREFVKNGGSLYASDWAFPYVEWGWENQIDFYGNDKSNEPISFKGNQTILSNIYDEVLAKYLGKTTIELKFIAGPLVAVKKAGSGTFVHINGYVDQFKEVLPFTLSFIPEKKGGRVIYTTFHNSEQITKEMAIILNYLVFLL